MARFKDNATLLVMGFCGEIKAILEEIAKAETIYCEQVFQYRKVLYNRGYFRKEGLTKSQMIGGFKHSLDEKYINVDRRFHRIEIYLTERGRQRLKRYEKGISGIEFSGGSASSLRYGFE